jgi:nitrite reductase/ring-hydroxylating ferredoxin subunit
MAWQQVGQLADLNESYPTAYKVAGVPIALYKVGNDVCATSNLCTHGQALLSDGYQEDEFIECPLHQGRFDIRTGRALCAPLTVDIKVYPVEMRGEKVWVDLT